jgi:hypothetical protein
VLPSSITVSTVQVIKKFDELVLVFLLPCGTGFKPQQAKRHLKLDTTPLAQHHVAAILTFSAGLLGKLLQPDAPASKSAAWHKSLPSPFAMLPSSNVAMPLDNSYRSISES